MKKVTIPLILSLLLLTSGYSSTGQCLPTTMNVSIMAGQFTNAGGLLVTNDGVSLTVTYYTNSSWLLKEIQLYVGPLANVPINNGGNPEIGNFPYKQTFNPNGTMEYTKVIPLSNLPECFIIAAHAVVKNRCASLVTETGWAQGQNFPGGSWATYFNYCKTECP